VLTFEGDWHSFSFSPTEECRILWVCCSQFSRLFSEFWELGNLFRDSLVLKWVFGVHGYGYA
jgi:hypothetical protein